MIAAQIAQERSRGLGAAPDYHALGTFAETWAFLELFIGRCDTLVAGPDGAEAEVSLKAGLDALETAARLAPELHDLSAETLVLVGEIRAVSLKRQAALQDLARASLNRLGLSLFALPATALGPNAAGSAPCPAKAVEELHLKACDLVRRAVLLLNALQARSAQQA